MSLRFALSSRWFTRIAVGCAMLAMAATASARTRPHYGGTLRVDVEGDPLRRPDGIALRLVLDGLTRMDDDGAVRPSLAVRWASENGNHRWQFWLRTGVNFHNNRPLNGTEIVASLEDACHASACPWTTVRALGQSVIFTSDNAIPDLPAVLAGSEYLIRESMSQSSGDGTDDAASIVGTGAFRVKNASNNSLRLEANDDCWQGRPFADAIEIVGRRAVRDEWMDLSLGKADIVEVHPSDIRQARQQRMNVVVSPPATLLELEVHTTALAPQLRAALALAVDRAALYQVIFQKQGEATASLLPASLSGYSFLFPVDRDLSRAQVLRGGLSTPPLSLAVDGTGAMQLAAERLALNLHDADFTVRVIPPAPNGFVPSSDLVLRALPLSGGTPAEALDAMLRKFGSNAPSAARDLDATYKAERNFLDQHGVIPLLYLPRAWAVGSRMRDLRLMADGVPDLANVSLTGGEAAP